MNGKPVNSEVTEAVKALKAVANERRLMIICCLACGEMCVGKLEEMVGISQSALSQHLARLRRDGFVKTRRDAQTIFYSLNSGNVEKLLSCLHDMYCPQTRHFV